MLCFLPPLFSGVDGGVQGEVTSPQCLDEDVTCLSTSLPLLSLCLRYQHCLIAPRTWTRCKHTGYRNDWNEKNVSASLEGKLAHPVRQAHSTDTLIGWPSLHHTPMIWSTHRVLFQVSNLLEWFMLWLLQNNRTEMLCRSTPQCQRGNHLQKMRQSCNLALLMHARD